VVEPREGAVSAEIETVIGDREKEVEKALPSAKAGCVGGALTSENLICDRVISKKPVLFNSLLVARDVAM
jgi:hypothetical protein